MNKKNTIKTLNELGFRIPIDMGATKCNFLDISLDTTNNTFKPYKKENSSINYINNYSNHPSITKKKPSKNDRKKTKQFIKKRRNF